MAATSVMLLYFHAQSSWPSSFWHSSIAGSSSHQAVGPVALMSLMAQAAVTSAVEATAGVSGGDDGVTRFVELSAKLAFLIGVLQFGMGLLKAGYLINFLSHPVLSGFTFGSCVIIASSQLNKAFGFSVPQADYAWQSWRDVILRLDKTHGLSLGLFITNMALFAVLNHFRQKLLSSATVKSRPWLTAFLRIVSVALIIVIFNTALAGLAGLDKKGLKVLGHIPAGLPSLNAGAVFSRRFGEDISVLLPSALMIALITYVESASVAKSMQNKYGITPGCSPVDGSQELLGLGLSNVITPLFGGFPVTGGFSRSGVNAEAGARTVVAGMVSGSILCIVVTFLTGWFYYLPDVALAALIMYSAIRLMETQTIRYLWAVDKADALVWIVTVGTTLGAGIESGLGAGAILSLLRILREAAQPHTAVLGLMPDGVTYRNLARFPDTAKPVEGISIIRIDGPIFFANVELFLEKVMDASRLRQQDAGATDPAASPTVDTAAPSGISAGQLAAQDTNTAASAAPHPAPIPSLLPAPIPNAIIIDMSGVPSIDSTGVHTIVDTLPRELAAAAAKLSKSSSSRTVAALPTTTSDGAAAPQHPASTPPRAAATVAAPCLFLVGVHGPVRDRLLLGEAAHHHANSTHKKGGNSHPGTVTGRLSALWKAVTRGTSKAKADPVPDAAAEAAGVQLTSAAAAAHPAPTADITRDRSESCDSSDGSAMLAQDIRSMVLTRPANVAAVMLRQVDLSLAVQAVQALFLKDQQQSLP